MSAALDATEMTQKRKIKRQRSRRGLDSLRKFSLCLCVLLKHKKRTPIIKRFRANHWGKGQDAVHQTSLNAAYRKCIKAFRGSAPYTGIETAGRGGGERAEVRLEWSVGIQTQSQLPLSLYSLFERFRTPALDVRVRTRFRS